MCSKNNATFAVAMVILSWTFFLLELTLISAAATPTRTRGTFGDFCNRTNRCESRQSLSCRNDICECLMTDSMTFDTEKESCVVLAGERCSYTVEVDVAGDEDAERSWREEFSCVTNSQCSSAGFCACSSNHFETANGTCESKKLYERECTTDIECRGDLMLTCQNGRCQCNATDFIYDASKGNCAVRAGKQCDPAWECVTSSTCDDTENVCSCSSSHFSTVNGTCSSKKHYGGECSSHDECSEVLHLACQEGTCGCNSSYAIFNRTIGRCIARSGASCYNLQECPVNSLCTVPRSHPSYYSHHLETHITPESECVCNKMFTEMDGTCQPQSGYGGKCETDNGCLEHKSLSCINGTCQCNETESIYNVTQGKCLVLSGFQCVDSYIQAQYRNDWKSCVDKASCTGSGGSETDVHGSFEPRKCQCQTNYFSQSDGICRPKLQYGNECTSDNDCYDDGSHQSFSCQSGVCKCKDTSKFFQNHWKMCMKPVDVSCKPDNFLPPCGPTSNAYCYHYDTTQQVVGYSFDRYSGKRPRYEETRHYKCKCHPGFTQTKEGYCLGGHSSDCYSTDKRQCNHESGLICEDMKCKCAYAGHQYFNSNLNRCVSYVGGPCGEKSMTCAENSECVEVRQGESECRCKPGFVADSRKCELAFRQPCKDNNKNYSALPCDNFGGLHCIDGICQCPGFQYFNEQTLKCRGLEGGKCDLGKIEFCTDGAECQVFRGSNGTTGSCRCATGFTPAGDRRCEKVQIDDVKIPENTTEYSMDEDEAINLI